MEARLTNISKTLAQSAIDAYNGRATFVYVTGTSESAIRVVYNELVIGAKAKTDEFKLAKNVTKVALIAYWRSTKYFIDEHKLNNLENDTLFRRAVLATHATLRKMIRTTNYQRRLGIGPMVH